MIIGELQVTILEPIAAERPDLDDLRWTAAGHDLPVVEGRFVDDRAWLPAGGSIQQPTAAAMTHG